MNYSIYLSSTLNDLADEREAIRKALSDECVVKHSYLAGEKDLVSSCLEDVGRCDAYFLVVGLRYGFIPPDSASNPDQLSITELEFRKAQEVAGLPHSGVIRPAFAKLLIFKTPVPEPRTGKSHERDQIC